MHCLAGISRSVTVTVAYLMHSHSLSLEAAYDFVRECKPNISPNLNFMGQLLDFENSLRSVQFGLDGYSDFHAHAPPPPKQTEQGVLTAFCPTEVKNLLASGLEASKV